jgi:hypothetical protein
MERSNVMTSYYLSLIYRDCIPERYVIGTSAVEWHNERTGDERKIVGKFATAEEAYDVAAARDDALIYKSIHNDFDKKVFDRNDLANIR